MKSSSTEILSIWSLKCKKSLYFIIVYYKSLSDSNYVKTITIGFVLNDKHEKLLSFITLYLLHIWEWTVQYFSSYLHDKHYSFDSMFLITYKRILYVNKLAWRVKVSMSMTRKWLILLLMKEVSTHIFTIS